MPKPVASVKWQEIANRFKELGFNFRLDEKPLPSGSGEINGYWFQLFWFEEKEGIFTICLTKSLETCGSLPEIVDTFSEMVFSGSKPSVRYTRASQQNPFLITYQWIVGDSREKIAKLRSDPDIKVLPILRRRKLL